MGQLGRDRGLDVWRGGFRHHLRLFVDPDFWDERRNRGLGLLLLDHDVRHPPNHDHDGRDDGSDEAVGVNLATRRDGLGRHLDDCLGLRLDERLGKDYDLGSGRPNERRRSGRPNERRRSGRPNECRRFRRTNGRGRLGIRRIGKLPNRRGLLRANRHHHNPGSVSRIHQFKISLFNLVTHDSPCACRCGRWDLNPQPAVLETAALTNWSYVRRCYSSWPVRIPVS
jgi:hypothetical protein